MWLTCQYSDISFFNISCNSCCFPFYHWSNPTPIPVEAPNDLGEHIWERYSLEDMNFLYISNTSVLVDREYRQKDVAFWTQYTLPYILGIDSSAISDVGMVNYDVFKLVYRVGVRGITHCVGSRNGTPVLRVLANNDNTSRHRYVIKLYSPSKFKYFLNSIFLLRFRCKD